MSTTLMNSVIQLLAVCGRDEMTDGELLNRFLTCQDDDALAALVRRHSPMVWSVCHRLLRNHHHAEDAFQATFLVLVQKAATLPNREAVGNWLYGVAHKTAVRMRGLVAKRGVREKQLTVMPEPATAEKYVWNNLASVLDEELSRLPDKYCVLIVLCDIEGVTRKDVARRLGIPEGTAASRLTAARAMLAKRLAGRGVVVSGALLGAVLSQQSAWAGASTTVVASTIKVATLVAAGHAAAGAISPTVTALTKGVMKAMFMTKIKTVLVAVLGVGLALGGVGAGVGLSANPVTVAQQPGAKQVDAKKSDDQGNLKTTQLMAAKKAYEAIWGDYQSGLHDEEVVYRWSLRILESQRKSAEMQANEIKSLEEHLDRMKALEKAAPDRTVIVPVERIESDGKPKLGVVFTKDGKQSGMVAALELRSPHAAETTAFFCAEAEVWLAETRSKKGK